MLRRVSGALIAPCALCALVSSGCGRLTGGLMARNGISDAKDVRYVVFQGSTWTFPQPPLFPLQRPHRITNRAAIEAFYEAMDHPKGGPLLKTEPNSRLAFVYTDGHVAIFAWGGAGGDCESSKADLTPAFRIASSDPQQSRFDTTRLPPSPLAAFEYHSRSGVINVPAGARLARLEKPCEKLVAAYNPLSLRGNVRFTPKQLKAFLAWVPVYLELKLKKPVAYDVIVVPPDLDPKWPPSRGDSRARLTRLDCDTVYIARLPETRSKFVRFVLTSKSGDCLATDAVDPRAIVSYSGKRGQAVYTPDLFDEAVSSLTKP